LTRDKLKLSSQINDMSKTLDSIKQTFVMGKVSKNGKVNVKLMDSLLTYIILKLAKEKDKIDSTKYRDKRKSGVKEFVFPDGETVFPGGETEFK
jgi:hypothetical protein